MDKTVNMKDSMREEMEKNRIQEYTYTKGNENPTLTTKYNAQHRFFGMSKLEHAMARATNQYKKLLNRVTETSLVKQDKIASQINKMSR